MRTKNALKNIAYTIFQKICDLILLFVQRTVFIKILGVVYLGVSGLFANIFTIFSLMELGVGSAIIYLLYKPIANKNNDEIENLMQLYKKIYNIIGFTILIIGLVLIPFLKYIVDLNCNVEHIYLIYILTLLSTSVSYFFSYKRALLEADQKLYISNFNIFIFNTAATVLRILVLIIFKNYILFLLVTIIMLFLSNLAISKKVSKIYPFINFKKKIRFKNYNMKPIFSRMFAVSLNNIGNVVLTGTDNILMSMYLGVSFVGIYANYYIFTNMIYTTIAWLFISVTAGIGNLKANEEIGTSFIMYKRMSFINYYFYFICCIMLFAFVNPLISIWLGKEYLLDSIIVFVLVINLYITGMRHTNVSFINASGLYYNIKYKPIIEAVLNLIFSIVLTKLFGMIGIFLGTFISLFFVSTWVEPYILYREWFKKSPKHYYINFLIKFFVLIAFMLISSKLLSYIIIENIFQLIILGMILFVILNVIFILYYKNHDEYKYFKLLIIDLLKKTMIKMKKNKF